MAQVIWEIQLVGVLTAAACALVGVFLVLRRSALLSDAIAHTVLFGIVIGYLLTQDIDSPLLLLFAAFSGVLTVTLAELLLKTGRVRADAAIGLVFPALFSIAVIIITRDFRNVHLDTDAVLLGELAFAPFNRATLLGINLPQGVWVMGGILLLNIAAIALFYKELKLATFDAALGAALGFAPTLLHYGLMTLVSVTAVGAFDHVGSILVIALMIAPPAAAYLLTDRLSRMLLISVAIGAGSAVAGFWLARALDINVSGATATCTGLIFLIVLVAAPERGLIARAIQRSRRRGRFVAEMLIVHLQRHENTPAAATENTIGHLVDELNWPPAFAHSTVRRAAARGWIAAASDRLYLTASGRQRAQQVQER